MDLLKVTTKDVKNINFKGNEISDSYKIKDFGNDTTCRSIQELAKVLISKYDNKSVAIQYSERNSEMTKTAFIDIKNKNINSTYKSGEENKLLKLLQTANQKTNNLKKRSAAQVLAKRRAKQNTQGLER